MIFIRVALLLIFSSCFLNLNAERNLRLNDYNIIKEFEHGSSHIVLLEDSKGEKLLLKMINDSSSDEQALLIIDSLGAEIAINHGIPINTVTLLPPKNSPFSRLATVHKWASGESIEDQKPWEGFTLHQRFRHPDSPYYKIYGPLPEKQRGLTREVLSTLSKNPQLAQIAALDTFLGNADRSDPNLFYDKEHEQFIGIDLAASFRSPLAKVACEQIQFMAKEGFSEEEIEGLTHYLDTLEQLQEQVTPLIVKERLKKLLKQSQIEDTNRLQKAEKNFKSNYAEIQTLIKTLKFHLI
ncbi:MAG: hypothetical protein CMO81_01470 [Waddliaceae bacterium]|nr:hypothetical protein [Waddliaceae bacterium]